MGGVAAFDLEEGIISPGGVGYDINCLHPDTRILLKEGCYKKIGDFDQNINLNKISYIDLKNNEKKTGQASFFLRKKTDCKVLKITTEQGEQLILTEDHPLYNGIEFKKAGELKEGNIIITHPFEGIEYEKPNKNIILDEKDIIKIVGNRWKLIKELKNKNLLPLKMDSEHLYKLSKLLGFITGDGWLGKYYNKKRKQNIYSIRVIGKKEDLEEIKQDINSLGYNVGFIGTKYYESEITQVSGKKQKIKGISSQLHINSQSLSVLMKALSMPEGNKSKNPFRVPEWIKESNLLIKRLYLAGLFGAELTRPYQRASENYSFKTPKFSQNKIKSLEKDGEIFLLELANLLSEFNIKTNPIARQPYIINKNNEETVKLTLKISVKTDNLINLWGKVGYEYCKERREKSMIALAYLKLKQKNINKYKELLRLAKYEIETENSSILSVAKKFGINNGTLRIHLSKQIDSLRIKSNFPTFEEFVKESWIKNTEFVKDKIESIEEIDYDGYVYDLTMDNENHNFIANSIVSHNCGVRLLTTNLSVKEFLKKREQLLSEVYKNVPSGLGSKGSLRITKDVLMDVLKNGSKWAIKEGYGIKEDIDRTEEYGCMPKADPSAVSDTALKRGTPQLGSLGSGNHFLEVQKVDNIFDEKIAKTFGIEKDNVTFMVHCGSRGLGHQVASDYIKLMEQKFGFKDLPDRELINAPINSDLGQKYYGAMSAATNFAFANRQMIMHWVRESFTNVFGDIKINLVYDVCHNVAKYEKHLIDGKMKEVCIHRKGATRSFGPGRDELPTIYQKTGQPVLIPGDMGSASYILVGTKKAEEVSFSSTAHGAGRIMSRHEALRQFNGEMVKKSLHEKGIEVKSGSWEGLAEESPGVYKDVNEVCEVSHQVGIASKVVRLVPLSVIKG
ncbi:MAG: RtcB family protein [Candidatus Nanoarchaeia archaeon]|nr:RtcB family protein [Candidatus Nanoarchaeia archaeon]